MTVARILRVDETTGADALDPVPSVLVVGNFDGVHLGHQTVLREAVSHARSIGLSTAVLTFDPHPAGVVGPGAPQLLTTIERRAELLGELGVERMYVRRFDTAFAAWQPERFARELRMGTLHARLVVVGENFRFGAKRSGDLTLLRDLGAELGFGVRCTPSRATSAVATRARGLAKPWSPAIRTRSGASSGGPTPSPASSSTATSAAARSASRPPTSTRCPSSCRRTASTRSPSTGTSKPSERSARPRAWPHEHRRAARRSGAAALGRDVPPRLRARPLRRAPSRAPGRAAARREEVRLARRAQGSDSRATWPPPASLSPSARGRRGGRSPLHLRRRCST